jgi:uncharacterized protein YndB with AHSA1/START domain
MPTAHDSRHPGDQATLRIEAAPEKLYEIVSDPSRMGELSPECTGGTWLGGATRPAVGAVFKGTNKRGFMRWSTANKVVAAEPGKVFSFETKQSGVRWTYRFEADGSGTLVTEERAEWRSRPLLAKVATTLALGGLEGHENELRDGMVATLERLKKVAEG